MSKYHLMKRFHSVWLPSLVVEDVEDTDISLSPSPKRKEKFQSCIREPRQIVCLDFLFFLFHKLSAGRLCDSFVA